MTVEDFKRIVHAIPYREKGMFYSEIFLFLRECAWSLVNLVIESGIREGVSTRTLGAAAAFDHFKVISIDRYVRLHAPIPNVQTIEADSRVAIPTLLRDPKLANTYRVGVLIDGPKGVSAIRLKDYLLRTFPCVQVIGVHDVPDEPVCHAHSHRSAFRSEIGAELDALIHSHYTTKYPNGPGLGIWRHT